MKDKHYEGEGFSSRYASHKVIKQVSIRISLDELFLLQNMYPDRTLSFAIRSLIHDAYNRKVW